VGRFPYGPVGSPDSKTVYVAVRNTVVPISGASGKAGKPIVVARGRAGPEGLAIAPDGRTVYAVDGRSIRPIDTVTKTAGKPIHTGLLAGPLVITPDGRTGYALGGLGVVFPVDLVTNTVQWPIRVGGLGSGPGALAVLPGGKTVHVANNGDGTVVPISTARDRAGRPIKVGRAPDAIAVTPDGRAVYVLGFGWLVPIDTRTNTAGQPIRVPFIPTSIAITPDGRTVWVAGYRQRPRGTSSAFVLPIRTATNTPGHLIRTGLAFPCLVVEPWRVGLALGPPPAADFGGQLADGSHQHQLGRVVPLKEEENMGPGERYQRWSEKVAALTAVG
jgi:DNA-binding beta-propeller fold protein YncE